jgi:hypothetical protein
MNEAERLIDTLICIGSSQFYFTEYQFMNSNTFSIGILHISKRDATLEQKIKIYKLADKLEYETIKDIFRIGG